MQIKVHMRAFMDKGNIRMVEVPDADLKNASQDTLLNFVFVNGQNEIQSQKMPSVSMGDIVELPDGTYHLIAGVGFKSITKEQLDKIPGNFATTPEYFKMLYK